MIKTNIKYSLWIIIFFLIFLLFNSWENEKNTQKNLLENNNKQTNNTIKEKEKINKFINNNIEEINIETNLISGKINLVNGNISKLSLKNFSKKLNDQNSITILEQNNDKIFLANLGLINNRIKNNDLKYTTNKKIYTIEKNESQLIINLRYVLNDYIIINKVYIFKNYSYEIDIETYITNLNNKIIDIKLFGSLYTSINSENSKWFASKSYQNLAVYSDKKIYKKISMPDLIKKKYIDYVNGGWLAYVDNYFITAWIPEKNNKYLYTSKQFNDLCETTYLNNNTIKIFPNESKYIKTKLFVGPKIKDYLSKIHIGLDLSIDYGIFWPIATVIFLLLNKIYIIINNWGLAIILTTIIIKLLFFHLSAISYKSLGQMKKIQPHLELLKERYKDNKKELSQAILELYKKEKINPLSGCLPILIQIPVFISLYYVLLESVELRHANFIFWIKDLSSKDIYYILPIIMCATMFIQQKLNPPVQDPIQQKVMNFMPFIFLLIFIQFPSGLVLYWIVNNILSIIQQWLITKNI